MAQRFSMGAGAIFMVQRVAPLETSPASGGPVAQTEPSMLEEMLSLVLTLNLDVISLAEMRRRIQQGDFKRRFVCFTFDGAYRSVKDIVLPLFQKRGLPFTVFAATDYLEKAGLPWWLSLEALLKGCDKVRLEIGGEQHELRCLSIVEKFEAYGRLFQLLAKLDRQTRILTLEAALKKHGIDYEAAAASELLSREELKRLTLGNLVTIGTQGGGKEPLGEMSYDRARESLEQSLDLLEAVCGARPRHLAYPGGPQAKLFSRDVQIARALEFETAVTAIEGALWPEHAEEMLALPRIALDNNPATLVRALMLGEAALPYATTSVQRVSGLEYARRG